MPVLNLGRVVGPKGEPGSSPNILDNWYFPDPINQRGQKEYDYLTSSGYTIDRWIANLSKIELTEKGVKITGKNDGTNAAIQTSLENPEYFVGRQVTFSALITENTIEASANPHGNLFIFYGAGSVNQTHSVGDVVIPAGKTGLFSVTATLPDMGGYKAINPCIRMQNPTGGHITVAAAKLELGDTQTLARQDSSGNWVLNDPPPNKGLELARCQRHQVVFPHNNLMGWFQRDGSMIRGFILTPVTMRVKPAFSGSNETIRIVYANEERTKNITLQLPIAELVNITVCPSVVFFSYRGDLMNEIPIGTTGYVDSYVSGKQIILDANL